MIYLKLFLTFFEIGILTFGGGYAMIPMITQKVLLNNWMTEKELLDFVAISESTPGPFAINVSTFIGQSQGGFLGALLAVLGVVLPSFIVILIVAKIYMKFCESKVVSSLMAGMRPAVIGLFCYTVITMLISVLFPNGVTFSVFKTPDFYASLVIAVSMTVLAFKKVSPVIIIALSAALGISYGFLTFAI